VAFLLPNQLTEQGCKAKGIVFMYVAKRPIGMSALMVLGLALTSSSAVKEKHSRKEGITVSGPAVLWTDPVDITSRDLFYGPGGAEHVPRGRFTFLKEDLDGTSPKLVVKDQDDVKWKVKMGIEARPETVAARLVWAVGYHADEDYFLPSITIDGMPAHLRRGQNFVGSDGSLRNVRLKRESASQKKVASWHWRSNPFTGARELNGLRTLMAVINNWDLKDENNAIDQIDDQAVYSVSDLGASFGCAGRCWPRDRTKGDLEKYTSSVFVRRVAHDTVSFACPARPRYVYAVNPKEYLSRLRLDWIGRDVPLADAKWMGSLLARLSPRQIHDAFRAAGYSQPEVDGFSEVLARRISALTDL
jgi:hypothetical protein